MDPYSIHAMQLVTCKDQSASCHRSLFQRHDSGAALSSVERRTVMVQACYERTSQCCTRMMPPVLVGRRRYRARRRAEICPVVDQSSHLDRVRQQSAGMLRVRTVARRALDTAANEHQGIHANVSALAGTRTKWVLMSLLLSPSYSLCFLTSLAWTGEWISTASGCRYGQKPDQIGARTACADDELLPPRWRKT